MHDIPGGGLVLRKAGLKGLGVFAARRFSKGESVLAFGGPFLSEETIEDFTYTIQVDRGLYVGSSGGVDDYVNHCCEPTCQLNSEPPRLELVAARDIVAGDEITFDYATCISCGPTLAKCVCGASTCRGTVGTFWDLDPALQARFTRLGAVPDYVLETRVVSRRAAGDFSSRRR